LSGLPAARREAAVEALVPSLVRRRFDVGRLPLVAWTVVRLAADDHLLVQVEHHFVHDGWSIAVFFRELGAIYEAFAAGRPSPLPELPVQYADLALWQRRALAGEVLDEQLAFWRGRLADPPPALDLPADRPRPPRQSFRGAHLDEELPPDLYRALRGLARSEGVTLFVVLLAAFEALVARVAGQRRFLLGSGIANRRLAASEGLIGMVVNTVALGADLEGDPTFRELLARVRREVLAAQAHPDLPLERLVADLQPERDLSRNPLFQVMFSFHDSPVPDLRFAGLCGRLRERHNGSAKVDLNVIVRPRAEQRLGRAASEEDEVVRILWEYATDLFDRRTVEALGERYRRFLVALVAEPTARLSALPLATAEERRRVLADWNATGRDFGRFRAVHRRFAERAAAAPGAVALVAAGGAETTYGELAARAGRLAAHLAARGTRRGDVVAVLAGRTPETVAGLLAVLEAGGAYLPLDPATPAERVATLLSDAGARVLLVDRDDAPAPPGVETVRIDREPPPAAPPPAWEPDPADLAYVVFTSGSTGRPKGVAVPHGGLANLVDWHLDAYGLGADDRASLVAGLGFDAAVWELWPPLCAGAAVCLVHEARRADPAALVEWLAERAVTVAFLPTPVAERAVRLPWPAATRLRVLLTGGDVLHAHPPAGLPFRLVNHYGPTEGAVVASAGDVAPGGAGLPDVGRPIANVRLYLLDERLAPVPPGVAGELHLGGDGLARGYAGRPGWTAERFVPDPFGDGGRLYATGDRARWTRDGRLAFLGRRDGQVKVRGVRIELGEVEAALAALPEVAAAAAAAPPGPSGEPWLVAWWQPAPGAAALDEDELRRRLARRLPEAMVPQRLVRLDRLPLTANGKLDRRALPAPAAG
ncbi:MAG TPA: amino acid adenylation domain-containing protein, partial [Thermoanaerobaculia bacterium]|nr:amino acid adenylation domain-containing protein [Thermoanaerobaculia bacterium]